LKLDSVINVNKQKLLMAKITSPIKKLIKESIVNKSTESKSDVNIAESKGGMSDEMNRQI
jgi:hypothetical protein